MKALRSLGYFVLRPFVYLLSLILCVAPLLLSGCGGFKNQYQKNSEGFYEKHYNCCGPIAIEKAINEFYRKEGVVFARNPAPRKEVSQAIQKSGMSIKEALCYFDPEAICITWPSEIIHVTKKYGFELIRLESLEELDPKKDIAIVLVHGKFFSKQYHWVVFPLHDVQYYYGKDTVIDAIYLLKKPSKNN